jgi:hypothetical protein
MIEKRQNHPTSRLAARAFLGIALCTVPLWTSGCSSREPLPPERAVLEPLVDQGRMPNVASLIRSGCRARVDRTAFRTGPSGWTSVATGKILEKHGIARFLVKDRRVPAGVSTVTSNMVRSPRIWDIVGSHGWSVGVVGWWATWPATPVNGFLVSSYSTFKYAEQLDDIPALHQLTMTGTIYDQPGARQTFPPELFNEVRPFIRKYENDPLPDLCRLFPSGLPEKSRPRKFAEAEWAMIQEGIFRESGLALYDKYRPRFFTLFLNGVDPVGHRFGHTVNLVLFGDVLARFYELLDETVGRVRALAGDDSLIVLVSLGHQIHPSFPYGKYNPNDGIFVAAGGGLKEGYDAGVVSLYDIVPTLLYLMGLPVSRDEDGEVLTSCLKEGRLSDQPIRWVESYAADLPKAARRSPIPSPFDESLRRRLLKIGFVPPQAQPH